MKNKKILAIGLCGAIFLSIAGVTYASAIEYANVQADNNSGK